MVPVGTDASNDRLSLLSGVGDALAGRAPGFGRRRADLAARFARHRGRDEETVAANWVAGALAELGLMRVNLPADAGERRTFLARADAPLQGARLIAALGLPRHAGDTVRWHREHDDGTGFPDRLRWDAIPADAAALGIVQAFLEAIEDPEEARPPEEALFALLGESGRRFGVELVHTFRGFVSTEPAGPGDALALALPAIDDGALDALVASLDPADDRPAIVALRVVRASQASRG
jgi:hypothetical protein